MVMERYRPTREEIEAWQARVAELRASGGAQQAAAYCCEAYMRGEECGHPPVEGPEIAAGLGFTLEEFAAGRVDRPRYDAGQHGASSWALDQYAQTVKATAGV